MVGVLWRAWWPLGVKQLAEIGLVAFKQVVLLSCCVTVLFEPVDFVKLVVLSLISLWLPGLCGGFES